MEGDFQSKGAPRLCAVKAFQMGSHANFQVPDSFVTSPLLVESFLHIHTWHTKYPTSGQKYALEFDIKYAGVTGIVFNLSTLFQNRWNPWAWITSDCPRSVTRPTSMHVWLIRLRLASLARSQWWLCWQTMDHHSWPSLRASLREHRQSRLPTGLPRQHVQLVQDMKHQVTWIIQGRLPRLIRKRPLSKITWNIWKMGIGHLQRTISPPRLPNWWVTLPGPPTSTRISWTM